MLKRYQVLLSDWQEEYVRFLTDKYDLSFSEVIRSMIVLDAILATQYLYPEYKPAKPVKEIVKELKKFAEGGKQEDLYRLLSTAYFEARKAMEYRLKKEKKQKR
jgi:hypothetical protein